MMACSYSLIAPSNLSKGSVKMLSIPLVATLLTALSRTIGPKIRCRNDSAHVRAPATGDAFLATTGWDLPALKTADTCTPRHIFLLSWSPFHPDHHLWQLHTKSFASTCSKTEHLCNIISKRRDEMGDCSGNIFCDDGPFQDVAVKTVKNSKCLHHSLAAAKGLRNHVRTSTSGHDITRGSSHTAAKLQDYEVASVLRWYMNHINE